MSDENIKLNHLDVDIDDDDYVEPEIPEPRDPQHSSVRVIADLKRHRRAIRELQSVVEDEIKTRHRVDHEISEVVKGIGRDREKFVEEMKEVVKESAATHMAVFGNEEQQFPGLLENAKEFKAHNKNYAIKFQGLNSRVKYMYIAGGFGIVSILGTLAFLVKSIMALSTNS